MVLTPPSQSLNLEKYILVRNPHPENIRLLLLDHGLNLFVHVKLQVIMATSILATGT